MTARDLAISTSWAVIDRPYSKPSASRRQAPRAVSAIMYAASPTNNVTVTPQKTATTTASTDEITENEPLIPQYHAVGAPAWDCCALSIPSGNAMPIKKPDGNNSNAETAMR